jgi:hypothetical protein
MNIQTVHITLRNPHDDADPGECAIINYVVDGNVVKVGKGFTWCCMVVLLSY